MHAPVRSRQVRLQRKTSYLLVRGLYIGPGTHIHQSLFCSITINISNRCTPMQIHASWIISLVFLFHRYMTSVFSPAQNIIYNLFYPYGITRFILITNHKHTHITFHNTALLWIYMWVYVCAALNWKKWISCRQPDCTVSLIWDLLLWLTSSLQAAHNSNLLSYEAFVCLFFSPSRQPFLVSLVLCVSMKDLELC